MLNYAKYKFNQIVYILKNNSLSPTVKVGGRVFLFSAFLLGFILMNTTMSNSIAEDNISKINKICAEAESRYNDIFANETNKSPQNKIIIKLYKYTFCPPYLEIKKGETVQFINMDKRTSHSVWFKDNGDDESDRFFPEESVEIFFSEIGEFDYLCGPHWQSDNMRGVLKIIE